MSVIGLCDIFDETCDCQVILGAGLLPQQLCLLYDDAHGYRQATGWRVEWGWNRGLTLTLQDRESNN